MVNTGSRRAHHARRVLKDLEERTTTTSRIDTQNVSAAIHYRRYQNGGEETPKRTTSVPEDAKASQGQDQGQGHPTRGHAKETIDLDKI